MPLVKRKVKTEMLISHGTQYNEFVAYVDPDEVKDDDIIVMPSSELQLRDLQKSYPEEYAEMTLKDLGQAPALLSPTTVTVPKAIPMIEACTDLGKLGKWFAEEDGSEDPRVTVLRAIRAQMDRVMNPGVVDAEDNDLGNPDSKDGE